MTSPAKRLRRQAAELLRLADELDAAPAASSGPAGDAKPDRILNTAKAAKLSRRSYSSLYRDARAHGFGWQLPTHVWQFSESGLRKFLSRRNAGLGEVGELGEVAPLSLANRGAHVERER